MIGSPSPAKPSLASRPSTRRVTSLVLIATLVAGPAWAGAPRTTPARPAEPDNPVPNAVVEPGRAQTLSRLARLLSEDRGWLTANVVDELAERGLWIDEVFSAAPAVLAADGVLYRVVLEAFGDAWKGFDPAADPYVVYLTHEVYGGLGPERVLGFRAGQRSVFLAPDFDTVAGVGVTLADLTPDEVAELRTGAAPTVQPLADPIHLGPPRPRVRARVAPEALLSSGGNAVCPRELKPTCSAGRPACTSGYTPFFTLDQLKIKEDHEPIGSPEIELYPVRVDLQSAAGGSTDIRTGLIFSGRTVTDFAGQSKYLPDVNSKNQWYTIGSLALFPTNSATEFGATLVDDDSEAGRLKIDKEKINKVRVLQAGAGVYTVVKQEKLDRFLLFVAITALVDMLGILNNDDDLFVDSLGVANSLYCNDGINYSFPKSYALTTTEWEMKGHFSCINPSCTSSPPPPPPPQCEPTGAPCIGDLDCCSFSCESNVCGL